MMKLMNEHNIDVLVKVAKYCKRNQLFLSNIFLDISQLEKMVKSLHIENIDYGVLQTGEYNE